MMILKICAIAVLCAAVCILLNSYYRDFTAVFSVLCSAVIFVLLFKGIAEIFDFVSDLNDSLSESGLLLYVVKSAGVMFITEVSADICERTGEQTLSKVITTAGKVEIILIGLPLFKIIVNMATEFCM